MDLQDDRGETWGQNPLAQLYQGENQGTTFSVSLPLDGPAEQEEFASQAARWPLHKRLSDGLRS